MAKNKNNDNEEIIYIDDDISISTESSDVPLDTKIKALIIDSNSKEYKEFLMKLKIRLFSLVSCNTFERNSDKKKVIDSFTAFTFIEYTGNWRWTSFNLCICRKGKCSTSKSKTERGKKRAELILRFLLFDIGNK